MRRWGITLLGLLAFVAGLAGAGYREATADPVVRHASIALPDWPAGQPPIAVVLLSDLHVGNLATGHDRLVRVVARINALHPDLILIAGDFFPRDDPVDAATATTALAPLGALRARLGVVAVPGNHDHWTGLAAVRAALTAAHVTVLANQAQVRGPLAIGAVDDAFSGYDRLARTMTALRRLPGARVILTHSPDLAARMPPDVRLLLAGHTHCGQIVLPFLGSLADGRYYEPRYRCGIVRTGRQAAIVTGGIGGSLPVRIGAPPDVWRLTLGP